MIDDPTPEDLEQLTRSVAMSGVLGDRDRLDVVAASTIAQGAADLLTHGITHDPGDEPHSSRWS